MRVWRTAADLALGLRCFGCGAPGQSWCGNCWAELPVRPRLVSRRLASPGAAQTPQSSVQAWAAGEYQSPLSDLVVGHKERGQRSLAAPLAQLLAHACGPLLAEAGAARVWLVPITSSKAALRQRRDDPVWRMARLAAARLRRLDYPVGAVSLFTRPTGPDQSELDRAQRRRNRSGPWPVTRAARRWVAQHQRDQFIVVDDVLTTGATLASAVHGLEVAGAPVLGCAVVAVTGRRGTSAPILSPISLPPNPSGV